MDVENEYLLIHFYFEKFYLFDKTVRRLHEAAAEFATETKQVEEEQEEKGITRRVS